MNSLAASRQSHAFYGWWMVALCTIVRGITAPGQTIGISPFIDHLIESLGTTRSAVATAYLIGTLTGALVLPFVGRWIDRAGVRKTLTIIGVAFACVVALTGTVQNIVMLALAFVGLRMLGQGSLSLVASTGVVLWFDRRRGFALAVSGMGSLVLLSLAPLTFGWLIDAVGWRQTWLVLGIAVAAIVIPIARSGIVDRPSDLGQLPDGTLDSQPEAITPRRSFSVAEAVRTPAFWTLTCLTALAGAFVTGLTFHNVDLLGERGLTSAQAAGVFIPQMVGSVSTSFVVGWMTDRFPGRPLMFFGSATMAVGLFMATTASPGIAAIAFGLVVGISMGAIGALSSALYPKWFGVDHIGSIKGLATTANVVGSAIGPLLFSLGNDAADSYRPVILVCAAVSLVFAVLALLVPTPALVRT